MPIKFGWPSGVLAGRKVGAGVCATSGNKATPNMAVTAIAGSQTKARFFIEASSMTLSGRKKARRHCIGVLGKHVQHLFRLIERFPVAGKQSHIRSPHLG